MSKFGDKVMRIFGGEGSERKQILKPLREQEKTFKRGDQVNVERGDRTVESDWVVDEIRPDAGNPEDPIIIVKKQDGSAEKGIRLSKLRELNK